MSSSDLVPIVPETDKEPLHQVVSALLQLKQEKKMHESILANINREIEALEQKGLERLDEAHLDLVRINGHSVYVDERVVPHVEDWNLYLKFIYDNQYGHLLERRPSVSGCREIFERNGTIPGVIPFVKRSLRTMKVS